MSFVRCDNCACCIVFLAPEGAVDLSKPQMGECHKKAPPPVTMATNQAIPAAMNTAVFYPPVRLSYGGCGEGEPGAHQTIYEPQSKPRVPNIKMP
jgi:hypothetical protein